MSRPIQVTLASQTIPAPAIVKGTTPAHDSVTAKELKDDSRYDRKKKKKSFLCYSLFMFLMFLCMVLLFLWWLFWS